MILGAIGLFLLLVGLPLWIFGKSTPKTGYYGKETTEWSVTKQVGAALAGVAAVFLLFGALIPTGVAYYNQINDKATIQQYQSNKTVYQKRATYLTGQFQTYLATDYPDIEKQIFGDISPKNVAIYLAQYPQLQSIKALTKLTDEVGQLNDKVYQQQLNINQVQRKITVRQRNPWLLTFLIPHK